MRQHGLNNFLLTIQFERHFLDFAFQCQGFSSSLFEKTCVSAGTNRDAAIAELANGGCRAVNKRTVM